MRLLTVLLLPALMFADPRPSAWSAQKMLHDLLPPLLPQIFPSPRRLIAASGPTPNIIGHLQVRENGTTSSSMDTTASGGATLLFANCGCHTSGQTPDTPVDSQSNTYTALTLHSQGTGIVGRMFYKLAPSNSASMTWHTAGVNCTAAFCYIGAFTGVTSFDATSESVSPVCTVATTASTFTPSVSGELVLGGTADFVAGTVSSVSSPLAIVESHAGGGFDGGSLAWGVQPSTSSLTVTFTWSNCNGLAESYTAAFKP